MKNLFLGIFLLTAGSATSNAAPTCVDIWGHKVNIKVMDKKHIRLDFDTKKHPAASSLSYNGSNSTSHYFTSGSKMAQIEKSVFTHGNGSVWYHYPRSISRPGKIVVRFECQ